MTRKLAKAVVLVLLLGVAVVGTASPASAQTNPCYPAPAQSPWDSNLSLFFDRLQCAVWGSDGEEGSNPFFPFVIGNATNVPAIPAIPGAGSFTAPNVNVPAAPTAPALPPLNFQSVGSSRTSATETSSTSGSGFDLLPVAAVGAGLVGVYLAMMSVLRRRVTATA
jgi:hypothetical protein